MTPKEKADELYEKFNQSFSYMVEYGDVLTATKEMCNICVDEIIKTYDVTMPQSALYWQEVKQEIEKL